ncbi:JmjC domain-containing protein [Nocardia suismassiliense]|uniref:JmjC domain-containing protein n=1 Tax=Nocardia suismassiliense TaxID=2077092 RepID=UPI000D1FD01A|nr:cupin domain-containing protein [Nocardia suismassiliense]
MNNPRLLDLADWFAPYSLAEFGRSVLSQRPFAGPPRPELVERVRNALGINSIEDVFAQPGATVDAWFHDLDGRLTSAPIEAASADRFYAAGTTLLYRAIPDFAPFVRETAEAFRLAPGAVKCQLFCSRAGGGTRAHFDAIDVITIRLTGRKTWRIAPNAFAPAPLDGWTTLESVSPPLRNYASALPPTEIPEGVTEHVLEPGAILHIPRGYWHETSSAKDSISLHLALLTPLRIEFLLSALKSELLRDEYWRGSMYAFTDATAELRDDLQGIVDAVHRLDPHDLVRAPVTDRPVDPATTFVRAGQCGFGIDALDDDGARITVTAYGFRETHTAHTRVSRDLLPGLLWIAALPTGNSFDTSDLLRVSPGLSKVAAQQLLATLEQARLVRRTA